jgi:hypothetical protein
MKSIVRTPKLAMADIELITVYSNFLKDTHDLIILKTLTSLKALNTDNPELSAFENNSKRLTATMTPSKMLKLSSTYFLIPSPNNFKHISIVNMIVKNKLATSPASVSHSA